MAYFMWLIEWMTEWWRLTFALGWWNVFVVKCRKCKSSLSKEYKYVSNRSLELSHNWGLSTSTVGQHPSNSLCCASSLSLVRFYLWLPNIISLCKTVCLTVNLSAGSNSTKICSFHTTVVWGLINLSTWSTIKVLTYMYFVYILIRI